MLGRWPSWVPGERPRAKLVFSSLMSALEELGVVCGVVHGDCIDDFHSAPTVDLFLIARDRGAARGISSWLSKMDDYYKREIGKPIAFTVVGMDDLGDCDPSELDRVLTEGIQVVGRVDKHIVLRRLRQPYLLITYDTSDMKVRDRKEFVKELLGAEEVTVIGSSVYKRTREGLVDKVGGVAVADDTIVVPVDRADDVKRFLEGREARYFAREVSLSHDDIRRMRATRSL